MGEIILYKDNPVCLIIISVIEADHNVTYLHQFIRSQSSGANQDQCTAIYSIFLKKMSREEAFYITH